jgi:hypothetical protein
MVDDSKNMGIPTYLPLVGGKFVFVGGEKKASDNVAMVLAFNNWWRVYYQDFCADTLWLVQAPISKVIILKKYLSSMFDRIFSKYVPFVNHGVTLPTYNPSEDRKKIDITTIYTFNLEGADSETQFKIIEL